MDEMVLMDQDVGQELTVEPGQNRDPLAPKRDPKTLTPIDREETAICIMSYLVQPYRITVQRNRLIFWFPKDESRPIEDKFLSNTSLTVDYHNVMRAIEIWKSALTVYRARKGEGRYIERK